MTQEKRVLLDDNGNPTAVDGDEITAYKCLSCNEQVLLKVLYETQMVVCPHCQKKFKARLYKNGHLTVVLREK